MDLFRVTIFMWFICWVPSLATAQGFVYPVGNQNERPTDTPGNANGYYIFQDLEFKVDNCHSGVDLAGAESEEVRAIGPGTVVDQRTGYGNGWGNAVLIRHDISGGPFYSLYAHMLDGSVEVGFHCIGGTNAGGSCRTNADCSGGLCIGDQVEAAGKRIGLVGSTGKSTGPHLHFAVKRTPGFGRAYMNVCDVGEARRCGVTDVQCTIDADCLRCSNDQSKICTQNSDCSSRVCGLGICNVIDSLVNYEKEPLQFIADRRALTPPGPPSVMDDNFNDNSINTSLWDVAIVPAGAGTIIETNQRIEMLITAGEKYLGLHSKCTVRGDFDVQVDFTLLNWPADNFHTVRLSADFLPPGPLGVVGVYRNSYNPENYQLRAIGGVVADVIRTDFFGKLRLKRTGSIIQGYYWDGTAFLLLGSSPTTTDDTRFVIDFAGATGSSITPPAGVAIAFDNFKVTVGTINCPSEPTPTLGTIQGFIHIPQTVNCDFCPGNTFDIPLGTSPANFSVTIFDASMSRIIAQTFSDQNGFYQFSIPPGSYVIRAFRILGGSCDLCICPVFNFTVSIINVSAGQVVNQNIVIDRLEGGC